MNDVLKATLNYSEKYYSFAYCLVGDDLLAKELLTDSLYVFFMNDYSEVADYATLDERKFNLKKEITLTVLSRVYELGQKRLDEIATSIRSNPDIFFTSMDFNSRAVIFLKHKFNFQNEEIARCLKLEKYQVVEKLFSARNQLSKAEVYKNTISGSLEGVL
jgi:hypothetical protein